MGLYLSQEGKSYGPISEVKSPYFVKSITSKEIVIQSAKCEWNVNSKFDSIPLSLKPDPEGVKIVLHWSNTISGGCWWAYKDSIGRDYPKVAHFGLSKYFPYVD